MPRQSKAKHEIFQELGQSLIRTGINLGNSEGSSLSDDTMLQMLESQSINETDIDESLVDFI